LETISEEGHLDRIRKNIALVRQARLVEVSSHCVGSSVEENENMLLLVVIKEMRQEKETGDGIRRNSGML